MSKKHFLFAVLSLGAIAAFAVYVFLEKRRLPSGPSVASAAFPVDTPKQLASEVSPPEPPKPSESKAVALPPAAGQADSTRPAPALPPRIFFRYNGVDSNYGRVAIVRAGSSEPPEFAASLRCEVLNIAGGRGICLTADRGVVTTYAAELFNAQTFERTGTIPLKGGPSRCRMSRDARRAALTVFVTGHSYASLNFSTQTLIIDTATNQVLADIETFAVQRDGMRFHNVDFNFWGVTFTPDNEHFYATLSTQGKHYLVKGDIAARTAVVLRENVECSSLSPDGSKLAYKKRLPSQYRVAWQLHVLDLSSGRETALEEKRSVDDQLEWLDDDHVLYALPLSETRAGASTNIWAVNVKDSSAPRLFLTNAYSPSIERPQNALGRLASGR